MERGITNFIELRTINLIELETTFELFLKEINHSLPDVIDTNMAITWDRSIHSYLWESIYNKQCRTTNYPSKLRTTSCYINFNKFILQFNYNNQYLEIE